MVGEESRNLFPQEQVTHILKPRPLFFCCINEMSPRQTLHFINWEKLEKTKLKHNIPYPIELSTGGLRSSLVFNFFADELCNSGFFQHYIDYLEISFFILLFNRRLFRLPFYNLQFEALFENFLKINSSRIEKYKLKNQLFTLTILTES